MLSQLSYTPMESGSHLLSHAVSSIVPSAAYVLTVVFGMGTGVSHKRIATRNFVMFWQVHIGKGSVWGAYSPMQVLFSMYKRSYRDRESFALEVHL